MFFSQNFPSFSQAKNLENRELEKQGKMDINKYVRNHYKMIIKNEG